MYKTVASSNMLFNLCIFITELSHGLLGHVIPYSIEIETVLSRQKTNDFYFYKFGLPIHLLSKCDNLEDIGISVSRLSWPFIFINPC